MSIVTLSTDIGSNDFVTGAIKGQILSMAPATNLVDITHNLSADNFLQAAYICANAFKYYPEGTIHLILANLFEYRPNYLLLVEYNKQFIICPDNGLLTMIMRGKPPEIFAIDIESSGGLNILSCTQYVANAIAALQTLLPSQLGQRVERIVEKYPLRSTATSNVVESQIIFIDNFENVVLNITKEEFEEYRKGRAFKIFLTRNEVIENISENYAAVPQGTTLAWFNAAGYLELSINKGNLAGLFGLQGFSEKMQNAPSMQNRLLYQVVRIFFE